MGTHKCGLKQASNADRMQAHYTNVQEILPQILNNFTGTQ